MTTIAAAVKKELTQAFKGVKFSVTTKRDNVYVAWEMTVGTAATKQAVSEIAKKYEIVEHHGSLMDDTAWSSGTSIYCYPSYTQEREEWAVAGVIDYNYADATWDAKYERFIHSDGSEHYHATKLYHDYVGNGVASQLIDEYGNEPSHKRWYYEKLNPPAPTPEPEQIEPETEAPIIPVSVLKLENPIYINSHFPSLNKNNWIEDYLEQPKGDKASAQITKIVQLTPVDYEQFLHALLDDYEWLEGEGGNGSHYKSKHGDDDIALTNDSIEMKKWLAESYTICVLVTNGVEYILADPQGYSYARYVGFGEPTLVDIESQIIKRGSVNGEREELAKNAVLEKYPSVEWNTSYRRFMSGIRSHDSANRLYYEYMKNGIPVEQTNEPQSEHGTAPDWMNLYQEWVATLVSQNPYTEIISYQEWFVAESERKRLKDEETALEAEIWELQKRLIELQAKRLKANE